MFNLYSKSKEPYLTVIRLWDNKISNILCSIYDPLHIGTREVGIPDDDSIGENSLLSTTTNQAVMDRKRKRGDTSVKDSAVNLQLVLKSITELCNNNKSTPITDNTREKKQRELRTCHLKRSKS